MEKKDELATAEWKQFSKFLESNYYTSLYIMEDNYFTWTIENFSLRGGKLGDNMKSPQFPSQEKSKCKWHLVFYPTGYSEDEDRDYIGIYVVLNSGPNIDIHCKLEFSVLNSSDEIIRSLGFDRLLLYTSRKPLGFRQFMNRQILLNSISDDIIKIRIMLVTSVGETNKYQKLVMPHTEEKLMYDFLNMFKSQKLSDFTVVVGSESLRVHRAILAARSPVFAAMFEHETVENKQNQLIITDMEFETVCEMIRFIYSGTLKRLKTPLLMRLLEAADKYAINDLKEICEQFLIHNMNTSNAFSMLNLADLHSAQRLKEVAIDFICSNPEYFLSSENRDLVATIKSDLLADVLINLSKRHTC